MTTSFTEPTFLEPTYGRAFLIWWALLWRSVLWSIGPGLTVGFVEAFIEAKMGIPVVSMRYVPFGSGVIIGILVGIYVVRSVLRKKYGGFAIRLVAIGPSASEQLSMEHLREFWPVVLIVGVFLAWLFLHAH